MPKNIEGVEGSNQGELSESIRKYVDGIKAQQSPENPEQEKKDELVTLVESWLAELEKGTGETSLTMEEMKAILSKLIEELKKLYPKIFVSADNTLVAGRGQHHYQLGNEETGYYVAFFATERLNEFKLVFQRRWHGR